MKLWGDTGGEKGGPVPGSLLDGVQSEPSSNYSFPPLMVEG